MSHADIGIDTDFPLPTGSTVLDIGGYHGAWSRAIHERYHPAALHIFEPVPAFALRCKSAVPRAIVHAFALGPETCDMLLHIAEDATSFAIMPVERQVTTTLAQVVSAREWLVLPDSPAHIDLAKINIEGMEYDLLDVLLTEPSMLPRFDHLLIQFHKEFPGAEERLRRIDQGMERSHDLVYRKPFVWERWQRRV